MKHVCKLFGIAALAAAIGFSFSGCVSFAPTTDPLPEIPLGELTGAGSQAQVSAEPPSGIVVEGNSLAEKFAWLRKNAEKDNAYVIVLDKDEAVPPTDFSGSDKTIILWGRGQPRTITLTKKGQLFTLKSEGIKLVLDSNIILRGRDDNDKQLIELTRGTVEMNEGSAITGNRGGAVYVNRNGHFIMNGGAIAGNVGYALSAVVQVAGNFSMTGGSIFKNAGRGAGLYLGTLSMSGGSIHGNSGDGVFLYAESRFTMNGGSISGNDGYGVFLMRVDEVSLFGIPEEWNFFYLNNPATRASIYDNKSGQVLASYRSIFEENGEGQNGKGTEYSY